MTWYAYPEVGGYAIDRIIGVLEGSFQATDLNVYRDNVQEFETTGPSETDIVYTVANTGYMALTWCNDAVSSYRCDQHYVAFYDNGVGSKLICHESGHAVGLLHGQDSGPNPNTVGNGNDTLHCLQIPINEITTTELGPHNSSEVNSTY